jgi:adenine deaminase
MGIITAINSDDAEMGRRLNQEAAKSIKYGGMSETDALKLVTLNPAKMLHIDAQTGSIKMGKDADLVLWSDNPLSVYARVLNTWVDGRIYFDESLDLACQLTIQKEKERLWKAMLDAAAKGAPTKKITPIKEELYHCEDESEF